MNNIKGTFMWAVEQMKLGKKVRRKSTNNKNWVLYLSKDKGSKGFVYLKHSENIKGRCWDLLNLEILEATDWEVVNDDKDWNLAEHFDKTTHSRLTTKNDVKKCRDLILEDISNWDGGEHLTMEFVRKRFGDLK